MADKTFMADEKNIALPRKPVETLLSKRSASSRETDKIWTNDPTHQYAQVR